MPPTYGWNKWVTRGKGLIEDLWNLKKIKFFQESCNTYYYSLYYFLVLLIESLQTIFCISVQTRMNMTNKYRICMHVNMTNKYRICMHVNMTNKYRICRCPRIYAAVFCMNWKRAGNFVKLFCFDNGFCCFCSFWFQLDCFCYRMNNKRKIWIWLTQDIRIIQTSVSIICLSFASVDIHADLGLAEADNADLGLNNSDILLSLIQYLNICPNTTSI